MQTSPCCQSQKSGRTIIIPLTFKKCCHPAALGAMPGSGQSDSTEAPHGGLCSACLSPSSWGQRGLGGPSPVTPAKSLSPLHSAHHTGCQNLFPRQSPHGTATPRGQELCLVLGERPLRLYRQDRPSVGGARAERYGGRGRAGLTDTAFA